MDMTLPMGHVLPMHLKNIAPVPIRSKPEWLIPHHNNQPVDYSQNITPPIIVCSTLNQTDTKPNYTHSTSNKHNPYQQWSNIEQNNQTVNPNMYSNNTMLIKQTQYNVNYILRTNQLTTLRSK